MSLGGDSLGEATVKFNSDVASFLKGLAELIAQTDAFALRIEAASTAMQTLSTMAEAASAKAGAALKAAAVDAKDFAASVKVADKAGAFDNIKQSAKSAEVATKELSTAVVTTGALTTTSMQGAANSVALVTKEARTLQAAVPENISTAMGVPKFSLDVNKLDEDVKKMRQSMNAFAGDLRQLGMATGVAGAAVAGFLTVSVKKAIEYESAFAGVRKTTDASEEEFAALSSAVRELSMEIPVAASELAGYMEVAGQLGIAKENMIDYTKTVAMMGVASNLAGEEGAATLARLATVAQVPQDEIDNLASSIIALGNTSAANEAEIANMAQRLAAAGATAKLSAGDIVGLAAALSSVGLEAEAGGTAFSKLIMSMAKEVANGGELLGEFAKIAGMSADQFAAKWKQAPGDAIAAFILGLNEVNVTGGNVFKTLTDIGVSESRFTNALLSAGLAADKFTGYMKAGNDEYKENVALTKEAAERFKTAESQMQLLKNKFDDLRISIGSLLLPEVVEYFSTFGEAIEDITDYAEKYPEEFTDHIERLVKAAAGLLIFSTVAIAISGLTTIIGGAMGLFVGLATALNTINGLVAGTIALSFGGVVLAWAAGIAILVAEMVLLDRAVRATGAAIKEMWESEQQLLEKGDEFITQLEKQGKITKEQADNLRGMTDATEKAAAATALANDVIASSHATLDAQLNAELEKQLGRAATLDELNRARIAAETEHLTAAQAVALSLSALDDAQISRYALGTAKEKEALDASIAYSKQRVAEQTMTTQALLEQTNMAMEMMGQSAATEAEVAAAKTVAATQEIAVLDAVLATRYNFTAEQIRMVRESAGAETQALLQVQLARAQDTDALAAELAAKGQSIKEFQDWNIERIAELRAHKATIIEEVKQINLAANEEDRRLKAEEVERLTLLQEQYKQTTDAIKVALEDRRAINIAVERNISQAAAEAAGVEEELKTARVDSGLAQQVALTELGTKHAAYVDTVLKGNAAAADSFNTAEGDTQTDIRNMIALWAESGISVEDAAKRWAASYAKLPPSMGEGNPLDRMMQDFGSVRSAFATLSTDIDQSMRSIHDAQMYFAPSTTGSPAPLDVMRQDFATIKQDLSELVAATDQAAGSMRATWANFATSLAAQTEGIRESMKKMDPTARFSPSILDNVTTGSTAMLQQWNKYAADLLPTMLKANDALQYANPLAHHSPSLLEQVISGWNQMNDHERRAALEKWRMFRQMYKDELDALKKYFANGMDRLTIDASSSPISGALESARFIEGPKELTDGHFNVVGFLKTLQDLFGNGQSYGMNDLALLLKDELTTQEQARQAAEQANFARKEEAKLSYTKAEEAVAVSSSMLTQLQTLTSAIRIPGARMGADLGAMGTEAVVRALRELLGGGGDPSVVPSPLVASFGGVGGGAGNVVNITVDGVRSEADIAAIAEAVYTKIQRNNYRNR